MTTPTQIVLATDFSPAAMTAVPVTVSFARLFNAKVTLLHVFQYVPKHRHKVPVEWMVEIIRRDVRNRLAEAKSILEQAGVEREVMVLEDGIPSQQILTFVQSCAAPLLVMGTNAVGGMERLIIGSTAEKVLHQESCPVVTVGPHVRSAAQNDFRFRRILYATDFSPASLAAVPCVDLLRQFAGAHLRIIHVSTDHSAGADEENERFVTVRKSLGAKGDEEYVIVHGTQIGQTVVHEVEQYPADLLILGVKRASAFAAHATPGIAYQIIAASPCPVLTVSS